MCLVGGGVILIGHLLGIKTIGAFREFSKYGLSDDWTAVTFFTVGAIRMVALRRNGGWKRGPMIRACCAFLGVLLWATLTWGILDILFATHELFISMFAWIGFGICGEMYSFTRALLDEKPKTVRHDGTPGLR